MSPQEPTNALKSCIMNAPHSENRNRLKGMSFTQPFGRSALLKRNARAMNRSTCHERLPKYWMKSLQRAVHPTRHQSKIVSGKMLRPSVMRSIAYSQVGLSGDGY